jgi:hypothetical protein
VTTHLGPEPSYCKVHLGRPLAPSQWTTCWKYGWDEPTTMMSRFGHVVGHDMLPVLIVLTVIAFLVVRSASRT